MASPSSAAIPPLRNPAPTAFDGFDIAPIGCDIIDVDSFDELVLHQAQTSESAIPCSGYILMLPDGKSPHTAYPFALHDTLILPWDYELKNGVMNCAMNGAYHAVHANY